MFSWRLSDDPIPVDVVEVRKNFASFADVHISSVMDESIPVEVVGVLGGYFEFPSVS